MTGLGIATDALVNEGIVRRTRAGAGCSPRARGR